MRLLPSCFIFLFLIVPWDNTLHAQDEPFQHLRPVVEKIKSLERKYKSNAKELFQPAQKKDKNSPNYSDPTTRILKTNQKLLKELRKEEAEYLELKIPAPGDSNEYWTIQLYRATLFSDHSELSKRHDFLLYRGIVKGNFKSLVSININPGGVSGIISNGESNYVIQAIPENRGYSQAFFESSRNPVRSYACQTDSRQFDQQLSRNLAYKKLKSNVVDTIHLYIECDYQMFLTQGQSIQNVVDYVAALYNEIGVIYENEGIYLLIDRIYVWTIQDPFQYTNAASALNSFKNYLNENFQSDFAQLLSTTGQNLGGIAFINQDCSKSKSYSFANIDGLFNPINSYSWDVHVCAHELGHNMGSPHTHDCVWGPENNRSIDGCYGNGSSCNPINSPSAPGTIMSYCHLTGSGVNFSLGFGEEPGSLIRSTLSQCSDLTGRICDEAELITVSGIYRSPAPDRGSGAKHLPARNAYWFKFTAEQNGEISISSCNGLVDTRLYLYTGQCNSLTQIAESDDDCNAGNGYFYASRIVAIPVNRAQVYYIEWDDRWSSQSFEFSFEFIENTESSSSPPCSPGNLNVGGVLNTNNNYNATDQINLSAQIMSSANVSLQSMTVVLENGAEIHQGSQFQINVGGCPN